MNPNTSPLAVADLTLAWLLVQSEGKTARRIADAIEDYLEHRWSRGEITHHLGETLDALVAAGLVERTGKSAFRITESGRRRALGIVGLETLPPRPTWAKIKTCLVARALGLPSSAAVRGRLEDAAGLRAAILRIGENLSTSEAGSWAEAQDALAWKLVGVDSTRRFSRKSVLAHFLRQRLDAARELEPEQALGQLAARHVGARRIDPNALRLAAVRRWIDETLAAEAPSSPASMEPATRPAPPAPPGDNALAGFAARVVAAAQASPTGRFGDDKVFIWHVMRHLGVNDEVAFKQRLIDAHRARLLTLSRADLVDAMDPQDVARSETRYSNATYHFVRLG
jgi:hypothetical protein